MPIKCIAVKSNSGSVGMSSSTSPVCPLTLVTGGSGKAAHSPVLFRNSVPFVLNKGPTSISPFLTITRALVEVLPRKPSFVILP